QVQLPAGPAEVPICAKRQLLDRAVPAQLEAIVLRVTEVARLVGAVVVEAVEEPAGPGQPPEGVTQRGTGRVADRDVVEPGSPRRCRLPALRLPGVESQVVVVAARRQEDRVRHLHDDIEPEY